MTERIDRLIEKYFDGTSTLQEEAQLRDYFTSGYVADRHSAYAPMFGFFMSAREAREQGSKPPKQRRLSRWLWVGAAACIVLLFSLRLFFFTEPDRQFSVVYVDGKKVSDVRLFNNQVLNSVSSITQVDEDVVNDQIRILNTFTE